MISVNGIEIKPTTFPDKTSQIWKLSEDLLNQIYKDYICTIKWDFENESELIYVAQLKTLLDTYSPSIHLLMPYLPFGRQDKRVDNNSTFALTSFATLLNSLNFERVSVLDAHNNPRAHQIKNLSDSSPLQYIDDAILKSKPDIILFPDEGAKVRYSHTLQNYNQKFICASKIREQSSGQIVKLDFDSNVKGKKILICDDLCDGGFTFILVTREALSRGAKEVNLYTTHGVYSKGIQVLRDAGIKRIFNYKGEVK